MTRENESGDHAVHRDRLQASVDGQLSAAERGRLEEHLGGCSECREEARSLTALRSLLAEGRIAVPAGFGREVMAKLPTARWEARHPRSWVAALVVIALLVGAAALLAGATAGPAGPLIPALAAVVELLAASAVAGAGLLTASWQGVGMALEKLLRGSLWSLAVFGLVVLVVDLLLLRLLARRGAAAERAAAGSRTGRAP